MSAFLKTQLFCEFKAAAISCKVHKTIYKPEEEHQIVSDIAQEPIIAEEQWLGTLQTSPRTCCDRQKSLFSGWVILSQLRQKAAFLYGKRPETQSEILEMLEVVDLKLSFAPYGR